MTYDYLLRNFATESNILTTSRREYHKMRRLNECIFTFSNRTFHSVHFLHLMFYIEGKRILVQKL